MISLPWTRARFSSGHRSAACRSEKAPSLRPRTLRHADTLMDDAKLDTLALVPLFAGRSKKELVYLASRVDIVRVEAGTTLTRQGRANDTFYMLLDGEVEVTIDQRPRATLRGGDALGEISMLERVAATATAVTLTPARLLVMSHRQFHDAILGDPGLRAQLTVTGKCQLGEHTGRPRTGSIDASSRPRSALGAPASVARLDGY
jgi:CRP-like cAMP-binding protein